MDRVVLLYSKESVCIGWFIRNRHVPVSCTSTTGLSSTSAERSVVLLVFGLSICVVSDAGWEADLAPPESSEAQDALGRLHPGRRAPGPGP